MVSYSKTKGQLLTINGNAAGDAVALNFLHGSNTNLGGNVALNGLTSDQLLYNFTSTGKNVSLTNNGGTFQADILAPDDVLSINNAILIPTLIKADP